MKKIILCIFLSTLYSCSLPNTKISNLEKINFSDIKSVNDLNKAFDYYKAKIEENPDEEIFYDDFSYFSEINYNVANVLFSSNSKKAESYIKYIEILYQGHNRFPKNSRILNTLLKLTEEAQKLYSKSLYPLIEEKEVDYAIKFNTNLIEFYNNHYTIINQPLFVKESINRSNVNLKLLYFHKHLILPETDKKDLNILFKIIALPKANDFFYTDAEFYNYLFENYDVLIKNINSIEDLINFRSYIDKNNYNIDKYKDLRDFINYRIAKLSKGDEAIKILESLILNNPKNLNNYLLLVEFYQQNKLDDKFIETIEKIINIVDNNKISDIDSVPTKFQLISISNPLTIDSYSLTYMIINYLIESKKYTQALVYLQRLEKSNDRLLYKTYLDIANIYKILGDNENKIKYIEMSLVSQFFNENDLKYENLILLTEYYLSKNNLKRYFQYMKKVY